MTEQPDATGPTGDPTADEILRGLQDLEEASPEEEIEAYGAALDSLAQLLEDQPRLPGLL
ncbi:hypothetical protein [Citricoccus nitrophenolicus]|uniref:hypothetical protein n=1 Tax=Citricoccus nitrophenolicus TaxID=863575 RepID=UPI0031EF053D